MKTYRNVTALALVIGAATLVAAGPARAGTLKNRSTDAQGTTFYLGVAGGPVKQNVSMGLNPGTQLIIWPQGQLDQSWTFSTTSTGTIQNYYNDTYFFPGANMCIDVAGGAGAGDGANLVVQPCSSGTLPEQVWEFQPASQFSAPYAGCYVIRNTVTSRVIGVAAGTMTKGTKIIQWPFYVGVANQDSGWHKDQFWCP